MTPFEEAVEAYILAQAHAFRVFAAALHADVVRSSMIGMRMQANGAAALQQAIGYRARADGPPTPGRGSASGVTPVVATASPRPSPVMLMGAVLPPLPVVGGGASTPTAASRPPDPAVYHAPLMTSSDTRPPVTSPPAAAPPGTCTPTPPSPPSPPAIAPPVPVVPPVAPPVAVAPVAPPAVPPTPAVPVSSPVASDAGAPGVQLAIVVAPVTPCVAAGICGDASAETRKRGTPPCVPSVDDESMPPPPKRARLVPAATSLAVEPRAAPEPAYYVAPTADDMKRIAGAERGAQYSKLIETATRILSGEVARFRVQDQAWHAKSIAQGEPAVRKLREAWSREYPRRACGDIEMVRALAHAHAAAGVLLSITDEEHTTESRAALKDAKAAALATIPDVRAAMTHLGIVVLKDSWSKPIEPSSDSSDSDSDDDTLLPPARTASPGLSALEIDHLQSLGDDPTPELPSSRGGSV